MSQVKTARGVFDPATYDIIIRRVDGYGWLPIIKDSEDREFYRGEFRASPQAALNAALIFFENHIENQGGEE